MVQSARHLGDAQPRRKGHLVRRPQSRERINHDDGLCDTRRIRYGCTRREGAGRVKYGFSIFVASRAPGTSSSDLSRPVTSCDDPRNWPLVEMEGWVPALRCRMAVTSSRAWGAHACQASVASFADDHGHSTSKYVALSGNGCTRNTKSVTMPKSPPPPPRRDQNSSGSVWSSTVLHSHRRSPSARQEDCRASDQERDRPDRTRHRV